MNADYSQSILNPAGPQARELYGVLTFDLVAIAFLWVILAGMIVYAIIRFRRQRAATTTLSGYGVTGQTPVPPQVQGNPRLELAWTVALIIGLGILALHPVNAERLFECDPTRCDPTNPKAAEALDVTVIARQYWWEFQYPAYGITTANELLIPAGIPVRLTMTSADVIHSLGIPRLGGKNDAIPGRYTRMWLQADEPGVYQGQCYELCGASHARMLARVIAVDRTQFDKWVQHRRELDRGGTAASGNQSSGKSGSPTSGSGMSGGAFTRGEALFGSMCAGCHTIDGTPYRGKAGPNLSEFGRRTSIGGGILTNTPENLDRWLANPSYVKPGTRMPTLPLTAEQRETLVTYLESLQ